MLVVRDGIIQWMSTYHLCYNEVGKIELSLPTSIIVSVKKKKQVVLVVVLVGVLWERERGGRR
jgi:hypothetical protein